jgi:hypothetical protein
MRGTRRWAALALGVTGLCLGCGRGDPKPEGPSASDRAARSDVLRDMVAAREKVDPEGLRSARPNPNPGGAVAPGPGTQGVGGSGRPEPSGRTGGRVSWVGDNELLFRDATGAEREVHVEEGTRLLRKGEPMRLRELSEGQEVRVSYDESPAGWVAREVEVVSASELPARPPQAPANPSPPQQPKR